MRVIFSGLLLFLVVVVTPTLSAQTSTDLFDTVAAQKWAGEAAQRCEKSKAPLLDHSDFSWGLSFADMAPLFDKTYNSEKRLLHRFYFKPGWGFFGHYFTGDEDLSVPIRFLYSLKKHIESALALQYAEWIIFPDMGHNHFFIDLAEREAWRGLKNRELMTRFMNSSKTKILYHTLEQIRVRDEDKILDPNPWAQWRYYTRNIAGDNQGQGHLEVLKNLTGNYNTVNAYEGYDYWGAGVNVSANKNGCFSYEHKGQKFYFDVSFFDLPYSSGEGGSDF